MRVKIKMELLSDAIFGNGMSIPGAEDISVLFDENGFPYYKGGTFKGILREEFKRYLGWMGEKPDRISYRLNSLFGESGSDNINGKLVFSDFTLSDYVKQQILSDKETKNEEIIHEITTNIRTFTAIEDNGVAKEGSLRMARCVDAGLIFYSTLECNKADYSLISEVISSIKGIGSLRNRGFGNVRLSVQEEG